MKKVRYFAGFGNYIVLFVGHSGDTASTLNPFDANGYSAPDKLHYVKNDPILPVANSKNARLAMFLLLHTEPALSIERGTKIAFLLCYIGKPHRFLQPPQEAVF